MNSPALVSAQARSDLQVVADFFGIDLEWNRHIFRHAAQAEQRAFETTIHAMAEAVQQDARFGAERRIRERIGQQRKQSGGGRR